MRGLGARRHDCVAFRPRTGGAIADGKNVVVARGLQGLAHHQLIARIGLEPIEILQKGRRLHAGRPDHELGIDNAPVRKPDAVLHHGGDARGCINFHAESTEQLGRGSRDARRQSRQNAVGGLDQVQRDVAIGINAVEAEGDELARRLVQFGGELDAGGAGADDRDLKLPGVQRFVLVLRPHAGIDQPGVKSRGLLRGLQANGVIGNARRAEIVGETADGEHQRVVGITARWRHLRAILLDHRPDQHLAPGAVEPDHLSGAIAKVMPVRLRQIVELMMAEIHAAGRDLVQQRLP